MNHKKTILTALAAALLSGSAIVHAQTLNIAFADPLSSMDPQLNNHAGDRSTAIHFWDLLIVNKQNKLVPGLASSWKLINDKTWEFKLRNDVKWQDGKPLTADDVIFSYNRAKAVPGSVATYAGFLRTIDTMTAKDPHTLIITTKVPSPDLPLNLASVHIVSKHVGEKSSTADYNEGRAMVGSGPYKFVSYKPGDVVTMTRNDDYWGGKQPWERVNYRFINNPAARTAALLAGDVDVIDKVSASDLKKLQQTPNISVYPYNGLRVMLLQPSFKEGSNPFITDNNDKPLDNNPLLDAKVRQALSLGINRKAITDRVMQNTATVANQWMPSDGIGYNKDIKDIPFDVERAKKLLAEAGYPNGFKLTMHVPNDRYPLGPETAQAVAQFWTRIGVKTKVEVVPWAVYSGKASKNEYAMSMLAWGNGTGEALYAMVHVLAGVDPKKGLGASNWGHYNNPAMNSATERATAEFDDAKREAIMQEAAKILSDDAGVIPLYHYMNIWAAKKGLKVTPLTSDRTAAVMVTKDDQK